MSSAAPPIFVKSNLHFELRGREYSFPGEGVSLFGISGLDSPHFDPIDTIGLEVEIKVKVLTREAFTFATKAWLTAEATADKVYLGARFNLHEQIKTRLNVAIQEEGYYPSSYLRKFPRIPARDVIPSMPLRTIISTLDQELIAFDIANMSPSGILLHSENPKAAFLFPGVCLHGQVEPRGSTVASFDFQGVVMRMLLDMNPATKNIRRYLGIKFTRIPDAQKHNFLEILKTVLDNIQTAGLAG